MINDKSKRILSKQTPELIGQKVLLKGWIKTRRDHGKLIFLDLRDRSGIVQLVVSPKVSQSAYKKGQDLKPESVIKVDGVVRERPAATINKTLVTGKVEIEVEKIEIISKAHNLPFAMGAEELNLELPTLLDNRSLSLRHPKISAIFKIQQTLAQSFRKTLRE